MAKAKKLSSGKWRVQASITIDGVKQTQSFTAPTAHEAELKAKEWQVKRKAIRSDSSNFTVTEAIDDYIEQRSNLLSPSTVRAYKSYQRNIFTTIENVKLKQITKTVWQKFINKIAADHSAKTVSNANGLLNAIMSQYAPIQLETIGKITLPQKRLPKNKALSKDDIVKLLIGIEGHPHELPITISLWMGLRRSEVCALTWEDVDFDNMTISVNKALVRNEHGIYVLKPPKTTDSERVLSMPGYIATKLKALPHDDEPKERIFKVSPNTLSNGFGRICKRCDLDHYRFHDLRRSMATIGLSLNIADKIIMSIGGWNNPQTMKNFYQIVLSDDRKQAENEMNQYFENLIQESKIS